MKSFSCNTCVLAVALAVSLYGAPDTHGQDLAWVEHVSGPGWVAPVGLVGDADGDFYMAGIFYQSMQFGSLEFSGTTSGETFLIRFDTEGEAIWGVHSHGTLGDTWPRGLALDPEGNVYVTGYFFGTATFGNIELEMVGGGDVYLAKFAPDGEVIWARKDGGSSHEEPLGIAATSDGGAVITGRYFGATTFGDVDLAHSHGIDLFVAKYSKDGDVEWAIGAGGSWFASGRRAVEDPVTGDIWLIGGFGETIMLGDVELTADGEEDMLLARLSASGEVLWATTAKSTGHVRPWALHVEADGSLVVSGHFQNTMTIGDVQLESAGEFDAFVARFNPVEGELELELGWAWSAGGASDMTILNHHVDASGDIWVAGWFQGDITVGDMEFSASDYDFHLIQLTSDGEPVWATTSIGSQAQGRGLAVDASGNVLLAGQHHGTLSIGDVTVPGQGIWDGFVAKYSTGAVTTEDDASSHTAVPLVAVFPNPLDSSARVEFTLAEPADVRLEVHDLLGRRVVVLIDGQTMPTGLHTLQWDAAGLGNGTYLVRLTAGGISRSRTVTIVR